MTMSEDTDTLNPNTFLDAEEIGTALAVRSSAPLAPVPSEKASYASGFEGIASTAFPEAAQAILRAPVDPKDVLIRPDGIVYLSGVWYRRRLTEAFGVGAWAIAPRGEAKLLGDLVIYPGALFILGRYISEAVGECGYKPTNRTMSYADALEGAKTNCLTRCCKDLLMGSELWDKEWIEGWKKENVKGGKKDVPAPTPPVPAVSLPRPPVEPPVTVSDEDFLLKCSVAMDWVGEEAFRSALDLFRVENLDKIPAERRAMFLTYLRKLPKKVKNA